MRLQEQYQRLYQAYGDAPVQPGLPQLAELWRCSERNARLQLARMRELGWLEWLAGRGRGKRSTLRLLQRPDELEWQKLQNMLARGQLEQAFSRLEPARQQRLLASLPQHLGAGDSGRSLRIPIPHAPLTLDPLCVHARLEAHLVRQIFDQLCRFDRRLQSLQGSLAHHWEHDGSARRWRFWLRPGLQFHDGCALDAQAAAASLLRLRLPQNPYQSLYRHLQQVEVHDALSFSCELSEPDYLWPQRLATANASITPPVRQPDFAARPIGSGPFRVEMHSERRLRLAAYDRHHGERALLNAIELWIIPQADHAEFPLRLEYAAQPGASQLQSACTYLLISPFSERIPPEQRLALMAHLASPHPIAADVERAPAQGLLPGWRHPLPRAESPPRLSRAPLRLRHYGLPCFEPLAAQLAARLGAIGIELQAAPLPRRQFFQDHDWWEETDLALCSEILHNDRDYSCFEWLAGRGPLQRGLSSEAAKRLSADLHALQGEPDADMRREGYRKAGDWLMAEGWILPLSHEMQGHAAQPQVAGLALGENGWTDFAGLWLRA